MAMKAAIVQSFAKGPVYGEFPDPRAQADEVTVRVHAAGLSRLVQAQAAGKHYSSEAKFPFVPGVDGVGTLEDGTRVYFAFPTAPFGAMAEKTVVRRSYCVAVPESVDDVTAAAAANPGMSSWAALSERAKFVKGESVLINGATGVAGRLAIQIARFRGASRVVVTGRNEASFARLKELGADSCIALDQEPEALVKALRAEFKERVVDVVLDYLWGPSVEAMMTAITGHGGAVAEPRVRFVNIGSVAGPKVGLDASALRSSGVEMMGSGLGSISNEGLVRDIGEFFQAIVPGGFRISAEAVALSEVEAAWGSKTAERVVFTM